MLFILQLFIELSVSVLLSLMLMDSYPVRIEIVDIQGTGVCTYGHKVGDSFEVQANEQAPGLCAWAFNSIFPFLSVLRFGGSFPWERDRDEALVCCPDPQNPVVFRITRIEKASS